MSIFGKIMGAIFGTKADAAPAGGGAAAGAGSSGGAAAPAGAASALVPKIALMILPKMLIVRSQWKLQKVCR